MVVGYDLIGDIHGQQPPLEALLKRLGYRRGDEGWQHPERQVIFLGDFIDRGPDQRSVVNLARTMVRGGQALSVMGNHEFNALAFHTPDPERSGTWLRQRTDKNIRNHLAFLQDYFQDKETEQELHEVLQWFMELPLFLDLDGLRVVHACWDAASIDWLRPLLTADHCLTPESLVQASRPDTPAFRSVEILLKGREIELPGGLTFQDKDGVARRRIRARWWEPGPHTYRSVFMGPDSARKHIPDDPVRPDDQSEYGPSEPPVFLGHYWLDGEPAPLTDNIACLDYSVARPGGQLVAYRWDGEQTLRADKFVTVPA